MARAVDAWTSLEPARAASFAAQAAVIEGDHARDARELAARAYLANGDLDEAVAALTGASEPELLRLRGRAQIAQDDYAGAVDSLQTAQRREEDPWVEATRQSLAVVGAVECCRRSLATRLDAESGPHEAARLCGRL
jgi:Flp pilus assembly protein TadD